MTYEWNEGERKFSLEEDGLLYEEGEPGNSAPQEGLIPGFVASEIFRLVHEVHELKVERTHREAAERQRDDKAEEIRCLRAELRLRARE